MSHGGGGGKGGGGVGGGGIRISNEKESAVLSQSSLFQSFYSNNSLVAFLPVGKTKK